MRYAAKKDINHNHILAAARGVGAAVKELHRLGGALDAIVGYRGQIYWVEIKAPGERGSLTPAERATIADFERVGCAPLVVETAEELLRGIGAI